MGVPPAALARGANAWAQKGGGASYLRAATTRQGISVAASILPSEVTAQLLAININDTTSVVNPSEGPTAAELPWRPKVPAAPTTQVSNMSAREQIASIYATKPRYKRGNFSKGLIIALPFHTANLNANVVPNDRRLAKTVEGYVYSKRRMLVVMWMYKQDMFCLPLYTFESKGIQGKPDYLRQEYVSVQNASDKKFENQGVHDPIAAKAFTKRFDAVSAVHITGGVRVGCNEDISLCGKLTRRGYTQLVGLFNDSREEALKEPWREDY